MIHSIQTYSISGGVELSFTDSGPPIGSLDYTTVILLHGGVFNAYGFHKVHDYAHRLNLRTVLLHRRDYAGSTPYSRSEIQELENGSVIFWERLSAQLGEFVRMFVEKESVPKLMGVQKSTSNAQTNGFRRGGSGGIAILGWSGGCLPIVSFLGAVRNRMMSEELYNFLVEYIGDLILYDPSYHCFGYPLPHDNRNYVPWEDQTISSEEFLHAFSEWVSSYYDHPCYDPVSRSLLVTASINDFDGQRRKSDEISVLSWTDEDLARGTEERPAKNEISTFLPEVQETLRSLTQRALFDHDSAKVWFPDLTVSHIGGTRTNWICAWAMTETKKRYIAHHSSENRDHTGTKSRGRKIFFYEMDGANHLAHWDRAGEFLQLVGECIRSH